MKDETYTLDLYTSVKVSYNFSTCSTSLQKYKNILMSFNVTIGKAWVTKNCKVHSAPNTEITDSFKSLLHALIFFYGSTALVGLGFLNVEVSGSHSFKTLYNR
jgi:hypothetical protein